MKELDTVGEGDLGVWEGVEGFTCKSGGEVMGAIGVGNSLLRVLKVETGRGIGRGCCVMKKFLKDLLVGRGREGKVLF